MTVKHEKQREKLWMKIVEQYARKGLSYLDAISNADRVVQAFDERFGT